MNLLDVIRRIIAIELSLAQVIEEIGSKISSSRRFCHDKVKSLQHIYVAQQLQAII